MIKNGNVTDIRKSKKYVTEATEDDEAISLYHHNHVVEYKRRMRLRGEIINKIKDYDYSKSENASFELVNRLKPTHFVTLQLKQRRKIEADNGMMTWARGDDEIYCKTYRSFMGALSKRTQPQSLWQKHKLIVALNDMNARSHVSSDIEHVRFATPDGQALLTLHTNVVPKVVSQLPSFIKLSCLQALGQIATITNVHTSLKDAVSSVQTQLPILEKLLIPIAFFV